MQGEHVVSLDEINGIEGGSCHNFDRIRINEPNNLICNIQTLTNVSQLFCDNAIEWHPNLGNVHLLSTSVPKPYATRTSYPYVTL